MNKDKSFPTGKKHISFSEIKCWKECSYRHKLVHIEKIDLGEPSPYLDFGTAVHEGCESILENKTVEKQPILETIKSAWKKHGFDNKEWVDRQPGWYKYAPLEEWCTWAENMWKELPDFLDETFPSWEFVAAEEMLYEDIENKNLNFKGYIDGIIKVPKKNGKGHIYWIIDWKTAQSYGWRRQKKQDISMTSQLILYKDFWSKKHSIELKDIRCAFVLLKRGGKPGKVCEMVPISAGPVAIKKSKKIMTNMISSTRKSMFLKNRNSCTYCQFKDTEHCT